MTDETAVSLIFGYSSYLSAVVRVWPSWIHGWSYLVATQRSQCDNGPEVKDESYHPCTLAQTCHLLGLESFLHFAV
jgi:hypothetical protein